MRSDTYESIENRFKDWLLSNNTGGNVDDVTLSIINSAQNSLWLRYNWQYLVKEYSLSTTADPQALPTDCGKIIRVSHDSDNDGRFDFDYYNDTRDTARGYKLRDAFTKAAGHVQTIEFFNSPSHTPVLVYQMELDQFTGTGTEYSFFPLDLIMLRAQITYMGESGLVDGELDRILVLYKEFLTDYVQSHQYNNTDPVFEVNDYEGNRIEFDGMSLNGDIERANVSHYEPDYDLS